MENFFVDIYSKAKDKAGRHKKGIVILLLALFNAVIFYYCLEIGNKNPYMNGIFYTFINILTVFVIESVIYVLTTKWWIASLITGIPITVLSIANYYTLLYRNQPVSTQDIHNVGTTMEVIGSYNFPITLSIVMIVLLFLLAVLVAASLYRLEKGERKSFKRRIVQNVCLLLFSVLFMNAVYFGENPIKPRDTFVWSWEETYYKYGYLASSIEVMQNSMNPVSMPEGYTDEKAEAAANDTEKAATAGRTPDIILILNETFYDLRDIVPLETDTELMPFIDGAESLVKGRCVIAGTGGGTNKSEYELLTSNSLQLMPGITPFNFLNFTDAKSVVSFLEDLGYKTWGGHCANSLNYSRGTVYPLLGFDTTVFADDFKYAEKYSKRWYPTDESNYKTLIEDYENMGDDPRFMYLLTIQNHGGWELNDEEEDLVHTKTDFGDYTDDVNEFLSCIKLSDAAFKALTEYFEDSERPVIICMVGDHAPAFAQEIMKDGGIEATMALRSTPYVMWANFEMDETGAETVSMPYIVPKVLRAANAPLSKFYSYMLEMEKTVPVITPFNVFMAADGEIYQYSENTEYKEIIDGYFNLVYNNAGTEAKRHDFIFEP